MKYTLIILLLLTFFNCNSRKKPQGVNFVVKDNADTLSYFYYHGHKKYDFFNHGGKDTVFTNRDLLSKIPGDFEFGIKDRVGNANNRFLVFRLIGVSTLPTAERPQIPFLYGEFEIKSDFYVELVENYMDSLESPIKKYEVYAAIDKISKDTILFQEALYLTSENNLYTSLITYDNENTREEMRLLLDDAIKTMKKSIE